MVLNYSVVENKKRKAPCVPLHFVRNHVAMVSPTMVAASHKKRTPAFNPRVVLTKLSVGTTSEEFRADELVFSQGGVVDAVFYIESGKVKLSVVSQHGKGAVVAILPEASFFGEGCLAGQQFRMATASADQKSTIVRIEKNAMIALLHHQPEFAEGFLTYLLSRNVRMEADLVDHLFNSSEKRLAVDGQLRAGIQADATHRENESGNPRRNDWHNPVASQFLHESVPRDGFH